MMPSLEAGARPAVIGANLRRVMAWFRHSAWVTVLAGLVLRTSFGRRRQIVPVAC
jgi:hypothetical protein